MRRASSAEDLVRHYDGKDNPFGIAFTRREYRDLIERSAPWIVRDMITHDFPRRALPFRVSDTVYRAALFLCPMMICAVLTKREAGGA